MTVKPATTRAGIAQTLTLLLDYQLALSMVLGGCCSNVWTYEELLKLNPSIGSALTFSQMLFITLTQLPSYLDLASFRLQPRKIPLLRWVAHVTMFSSAALLNNWAYAYDVPLPVMIVFRSSGLAISMLLGFLLLNKRYSIPQILCVLLVSTGVVLASLSRPTKKTRDANPTDPTTYATGIAMLTVSSLMTGLLGVMQEKTYSKYGKYWQEGVFYTHFLSLPIFIFLYNDVKQGFRSMHTASLLKGASTFAGKSQMHAYVVMTANLVSQLICVSGVNRLSSQTNSVTTNIVLTIRKALSLCFSVWWYQTGWNDQIAVGAGLVFVGSGVFGMLGKKAESKGSRQKARAVVLRLKPSAGRRNSK